MTGDTPREVADAPQREPARRCLAAVPCWHPAEWQTRLQQCPQPAGHGPAGLWCAEHASRGWRAHDHLCTVAQAAREYRRAELRLADCEYREPRKECSPDDLSRAYGWARDAGRLLDAALAAIEEDRR